MIEINKYVIYGIFEIINDKQICRYIGRSRNFDLRIKQHLSDKKSKKKYEFLSTRKHIFKVILNGLDEEASKIAENESIAHFETWKYLNKRMEIKDDWNTKAVNFKKKKKTYEDALEGAKNRIKQLKNKK